LNGGGADQPTVLASMWKHRMVMAASIVVFAAAAVVVTTALGRDYASRAGLLLQDPQPANSSGSQPRDDAMRYVADQVAILKSRAIADRASEIARSSAAHVSIDRRTISRNLSVSSSENSNYVTVTVRADDPEVSRAAANAVVQAYRGLTRATIEADARAARHRIDVAISAAETAAAETTGSSAAAQGQHAAALDLLDTLRVRLSDLEANARLAGDGVALVAPADRGTKQGVSLPVALLIALVLGGLAGAGASYVIESRRPALTTAGAPREILDVPALAEIPDFGREGVRTHLPILDSPRMPSADAFRFLAFELGLRQNGIRGSFRLRTGGATAPAEGGNDGGTRVVAFVASSHNAGASTIVANTALAAAQEGRSVLTVDADLVGRGLTRLLCDDQPTGPTAADVGLVDVLAEGIHKEIGAAATVEGRDGAVRVLPLGTPPPDMMSVFQPEHVLATLDRLGRAFDLVLVDVPPVVDVAYSSALLRAAASVVVVVPHAIGAAELMAVRERFDLIGVRPIGYVYNRGARKRGIWRQALGRLARTDARRPSVASRSAATVTSTRLQ